LASTSVERGSTGPVAEARRRRDRLLEGIPPQEAADIAQLALDIADLLDPAKMVNALARMSFAAASPSGGFAVGSLSCGTGGEDGEAFGAAVGAAAGELLAGSSASPRPNH
jgi:hypothetical protein